MLPWELNGWLQYGDGKFMYFQTGGWCSMLLGVWDIPGHWGHLIWWRHRVWVAPGQGGPLGNYLSSLYCQIIDSIREIGATSPSHLGWTRDIPGQMRLLSGNISHPSEPEPCALCPENHCVPRVTWGQGTKTHTGERSRCSLTGTQPFKRAARGLRGLSTEHLPQFKLELGHEKFKMDPCNF